MPRKKIPKPEDITPAELRARAGERAKLIVTDIATGRLAEAQAMAEALLADLNRLVAESE